MRANSQPSDVVMTRLPWQFNWQTERPALMVPNTIDPQVFLRIARYYNVRYLVLDSAQRPNTDVRAMIDELLENPQMGFEKEYEATSVVAGRATGHRRRQSGGDGADWELGAGSWGLGSLPVACCLLPASPVFPPPPRHHIHR